MEKLSSKRDIGQSLEEFACAKLREQGLKIIERNYLCKMGEIDLIARDNSQLIFIEVRYRKSNIYGGSLESISLKKQQRIIKTAFHYLQKQNLLNKIACRFDVIALSGSFNKLEYNWIKAAFDLSR